MACTGRRPATGHGPSTASTTSSREIFPCLSITAFDLSPQGGIPAFRGYTFLCRHSCGLGIPPFGLGPNLGTRTRVYAAGLREFRPSGSLGFASPGFPTHADVVRRGGWIDGVIVAAPIRIHSADRNLRRPVSITPGILPRRCISCGARPDYGCIASPVPLGECRS